LLKKVKEKIGKILKNMKKSENFQSRQGPWQARQRANAARGAMAAD